MQYPLDLSFKIMALAPQISVTDASGGLVFYVKQKLFKLKEEITVFADAKQTQPLYKINADRVLDFSARYHFTDVNGAELGSVKREGMRSLWRAHYDIFEGDALVMTIREENPWVKVLDGLFGQIPFIGMFSGYLFHPAFLVSRSDGTVVMRLKKQPAFLESKFTIEKQAELDEGRETRVLLSLLMMILLERARG
ncbi:MAG: hypothetical protein IIA51_10005 [Chloroflexi bacterium]|nr:hypothetical protein [Chloroflexota bacterium]MCH8337490.1 hypothetical protein [Chloroflexota bacterium]MCH8341872.1 hypothetical protein [Chloroflexota bacterium]MCH8877828.1 hypothetical protein [Chloroflexota bacterium]MCI0772664.1 hypothetical protein [Chloroflexota bacterium]